jgi:hypothetical protein
MSPLALARLRTARAALYRWVANARAYDRKVGYVDPARWPQDYYSALHLVRIGR